MDKNILGKLEMAIDDLSPRLVGYIYRLVLGELSRRNIRQDQDPQTFGWAYERVLEKGLQNLESQCFLLDKEHPKNYELMLEKLRDAIDDRLTNHRW